MTIHGADGGRVASRAPRRLIVTEGRHGQGKLGMGTGPLVQDEIAMLDGLRFHYRDWGDPTAPPVVLLHAYLQHARTWDTVAETLADRFRVLALDQRGFGESEWAADYHELRLVADVAEFADSLGLGIFSMIGFSTGGSAAITYAQLYPDRVQ